MKNPTLNKNFNLSISAERRELLSLSCSLLNEPQLADAYF